MTKTINQQGFAHLWVVLLLVVVAVSAVGITVAKHSSQQKLNSENSVQLTSAVKPLPSNLNGLLPVEKVKQLATEDRPNTTVSQVGLVQTDDGTVFHVELNDGSALDLDARSGNKVTTAKVGDDTEGAEIPANFIPAIDFTKAQQVALTQVSSGTITRIELEAEDGVTVYSVRFSTGAKVEISATDGSVVKVSAAKAQGKQPTTSKDTSAENSNENEKSSSSSGENKSSGSSDTSHSSTTASTENSSSSNSGSSSSSGTSGSSGSGSDGSSSGSH